MGNIIILYPLVLDTQLAKKTKELLLLAGLNKLEEQKITLTIVK